MSDGHNVKIKSIDEPLQSVPVTSDAHQLEEHEREALSKIRSGFAIGLMRGQLRGEKVAIICELDMNPDEDEEVPILVEGEDVGVKITPLAVLLRPEDIAQLTTEDGDRLEIETDRAVSELDAEDT